MTRALSIALAFLVLLVAADASARGPWRPRPRPRPPRVSMRLVDGQGNPLRTFNHHGATFVLGDMGHRYGIELTNHGAERVEVVVSVDGRDVVHGRRSRGAADRGYIVPAFGSTVIRGFRTSLDEVAAFRFTSPSDSFAGRHGQAHSVGVIRAMVFREKTQQIVRPRPMRPGMRSKRAPSSSVTPRAPAPRGGTRADRSADRRRGEANNLGTQFGERTTSHVREVTFARARPQLPNQTLMVRYDDAAGLQARGIGIFTAPPPSDGPFIGVGAPGPGWRRQRQPPSRFAQPPP